MKLQYFYEYGHEPVIFYELQGYSYVFKWEYVDCQYEEGNGTGEFSKAGGGNIPDYGWYLYEDGDGEGDGKDLLGVGWMVYK